MTTQTAWLLDRVIHAAEDHDLTRPSQEYGPIILTAVASAILKELHSGTRGMPARVRWAGMSCWPHEPSSWQGILIPLSVGSSVQEPVPFALPDAVGAAIHAVLSAQSHSPCAALAPLKVPSGATNLAGLPTSEMLYYRSTTLHLPEPHGTIPAGWLLGSDHRLDSLEEGDVERALTQAERIVGDRLMHGLGSSRSAAALLASVDDAFRDSLRVARSPAGLMEFLDALEAEAGTRTPRQSPATGQTAPADDVNCHFDSTMAGARVLAILASAYAVTDPSPMVRVNVARLRTPHGQWHGWVEFSHGFAGLRKRTLLVDVCASSSAIEAALGRYFSLTPRTREGVELLLLLLGPEATSLERHSRHWSPETGVRFASFE